MPSITREQAQKWDAQARGGFHFDVRYYVVWGEKELRKTVELPGGRYVEFKIGYRAEYETKTSDYGCKWNVETGRHIPQLSVTVWTPTATEGVYTSHGYGQHIDIGPAQTKKNYKVLCQLSETVNTDEHMPTEAA